MKKNIEKLEDINVMEGIDFKYNRKLKLLDDKIRKEKVKIAKKEYRNNIIGSILIIITIGLIIMLGYILSEEDKKVINNCQNEGYSERYCYKHYLGN